MRGHALSADVTDRLRAHWRRLDDDVAAEDLRRQAADGITAQLRSEANAARLSDINDELPGHSITGDVAAALERNGHVVVAVTTLGGLEYVLRAYLAGMRAMKTERP